MTLALHRLMLERMATFSTDTHDAMMDVQFDRKYLQPGIPRACPVIECCPTVWSLLAGVFRARGTLVRKLCH
jgi:hypothetical protein